MTFKKGEVNNPNGARKERKFFAALERAILQDDGDRLRKAAESLLSQAAAGENWAISQLADRLDGKPGQSIEMNVNKQVTEYSREELIDRINALRERRAGVERGLAEAGSGQAKPSELH